MTADHWIQIAAIVTPSITALTVCGLTLRAASRSSHPNPAPETQIAPQRKSSTIRSDILQITTWFGIFLNIAVLCFQMRPAPLTRFAVLLIASNVAAIGLLIVSLLSQIISKTLSALNETDKVLFQIIQVTDEIQTKRNTQT
jgi:hypothetical protein